ncbi:TRAP transporter small permease [Halocella sp. SP3-1]|uniref:TRAP transporter small permease n=1 Tax=Halocella sp. SP3-1 TaxID=2382161 RepID=UPI000F759274|nr:TRAP transporter small permease [Halocella sp. SP3-1]AZO93365.1 TRAP transporter small permease [Halocella sp. SP3-1]
MKKTIEKIDLYFTELINLIISLLFIAMFIVIIIGVWKRYVINNPWFGAEEAARYLMVYLVFIGICSAYNKNRHPSLTFVINRFSPAFRRVWFIIIDLIIFVLLIYMFKYGMEKTVMAVYSKTPALRLPFNWIFISIPIGSVLMMIQLVLKYLKVVFIKEKD